jgi:hypothetical protein
VKPTDTTAPAEPIPAAGQVRTNLSQGLWRSPGSKIKAMLLVGIFGAIMAIILMGSKKAPAQTPPVAATHSMDHVAVAEEAAGGTVTNPEVDGLIQRVEKAKAKEALARGTTYVALAPSLEGPATAAPTTTPVIERPAMLDRVEHERELVAVAKLETRLAQLNQAPLEERVFSEKSGDGGQIPVSMTGASSGSTVVDASGHAHPAEPTSETQSDHKAVVFKEYPAGKRWWGTLETAIDSYAPGPIKVRIEQGPYAGAEALGAYQVSNDTCVAITFTKLVKDNLEMPIQAIGTEPTTGVACIAAHVDHHWAQRLVLPTVAAALGTYAQAASFGGSTTLSAVGTTVSQPQLSTSERAQYAVGRGVMDGITPQLLQQAQKIQNQVTLPMGTPVALMLTEGI